MADQLGVLLVDTSAWHRAGDSRVMDAWERASQMDRLAVTQPVRLEILYSAHSSEEYDDLSRELDGLHQLPCTVEAFDRALYVQQALAHSRPLHHRSVKLPDLLIAAVAELHEAVVWHYDADFDRIAQVTGQRVEWVARKGTL